MSNFLKSENATKYAAIAAATIIGLYLVNRTAAQVSAGAGEGLTAAGQGVGTAAEIVAGGAVGIGAAYFLLPLLLL